jgi:hypothetical protein
MSNFSSLSLVVEIPWVTSDDAGAPTVGYLPQADDALSDAIWPSRREQAPATLEALALRLLAPHADDRPAKAPLALPEYSATVGSAAARRPSFTGIVLAARFLAFQRGAESATVADGIESLKYVCPASLAAALQHPGLTAPGAGGTADDVPEAAPVGVTDIVQLIATFGTHINASLLGRVILDLAQLLRVSGAWVEDLTDARAFSAHLLRRILPALLVEQQLTVRSSPCAVIDIVAGTPMESVLEFVRRIFLATLAVDVRKVNTFVFDVLDDAGLEWDPSELVISESSGRPVAKPPETREAAERASAGLAAVTRLIPAQPALASLLVGKAMLLGTGVEPSATLLTGGTTAARLVLLRAVARATDAALVTVDASDLESLPQARAIEQPADTRVTTGTIVLVEGIDHLRLLDDHDSDWQRAYRVEPQRALARLLAQGIPLTLVLTLWPHAPAWFVCGSDAETGGGAASSSFGAAGGLLPALRDLLGDEGHLWDVSIPLMVELLRPLYRVAAGDATARATTTSPGDAIEVSDATIVTAARLAYRRQCGVQGARHAIEAAARRAVLRLPKGSVGARIVITPDDLSIGDVSR